MRDSAARSALINRSSVGGVGGVRSSVARVRTCVRGAVTLETEPRVERRRVRPRHAADRRLRVIPRIGRVVRRERQADLLRLIVVEHEDAVLFRHDARVALAERQSLSCSHVSRQSCRLRRDGACRSSYPQPKIDAFDSTHAAPSGQRFGWQLKMVQYPSGCEVSQSRSPVVEQSVDSRQLSPIDGLHPRTPKKRRRARRRIRGEGFSRLTEERRAPNFRAFSMTTYITVRLHQLRRVRAGVPERSHQRGRRDLRHRPRALHRVRRLLRSRGVPGRLPGRVLPARSEPSRRGEAAHRARAQAPPRRRRAEEARRVERLPVALPQVI